MTEAGRVVGDKYRLIHLLGKGGMGAVWVAEHIDLRSSVAVKFINAPIARAEQARQRFRREARAAAALRGPNVVQVFDYGIDQGDPYLVMELLQGETLGERLERRGRLSIEETTQIAEQIANALARAHEQGIVHRDLKPANVFLVKEGKGYTVKLLDFGLAKLVGLQSGTIVDLTQPGSPVGTLQYMSPEQLSGGKVDARADVWSFAIVVFECLTGRLPFRDTSRKALVPAIGGKAIEPPSSFADVPAGFDAWFARATRRNSSDREASVRRLAEEFSELTRGLSGRCKVHRARKVKPLPSYKAYPSTNDSLARSHPLSRAHEASVAAAINGRRDMDHIALIAKLSRSTGVLWTRHKGEPGQWIRLTLHFEDDEQGHTTLAKVLRVNHGPSARPALWAYEVTVRFAQPIERASARRVRAASSE